MSISKPETSIKYPPGEKHEWGNPLFVDATKRKCIACRPGQDIRPLGEFTEYKNGTYSALCRACQRIEVEYVQATTQEKALAASQTVATTLKRVARKTSSEVPVQKLIEQMYHPIAGGNKWSNVRTFRKIGEVYRNVLERATEEAATGKDLELAVKVGQNIVSNAIQAEPKRSAFTEIEDMTEDERRDYLAPVARHMILADKKLRDEILNDPEVRKQMLVDLGIQVVDASAVSKTEKAEWE